MLEFLFLFFTKSLMQEEKGAEELTGSTSQQYQDIKQRKQVDKCLKMESMNVVYVCLLCVKLCLRL